MVLLRGCTDGDSGWGGRIRTSTLRMNNAVSYQLDHTPAGADTVLLGVARGLPSRSVESSRKAEKTATHPTCALVDHNRMQAHPVLRFDL